MFEEGGGVVGEGWLWVRAICCFGTWDEECAEAGLGLLGNLWSATFCNGNVGALLKKRRLGKLVWGSHGSVGHLAQTGYIQRGRQQRKWEMSAVSASVTIFSSQNAYTSTRIIMETKDRPFLLGEFTSLDV